VVSESLSGWLLGAFGALVTFGAAIVTIRAVRRDRAEDRQTKVETSLGETKQDVTHVEGFLEATTKFRPRPK
jgi:hypothetical protein